LEEKIVEEILSFAGSDYVK